MADIAGITFAFGGATTRSLPGSDEERVSPVERFRDVSRNREGAPDETRIEEATGGLAPDLTPRTGTDQTARDDTPATQRGRVIEDQVTLSPAGRAALEEQIRATANEDTRPGIATASEIAAEAAATPAAVSAFDPPATATAFSPADTTGSTPPSAADGATATATTTPSPATARSQVGNDNSDNAPGVETATAAQEATGIAAAEQPYAPSQTNQVTRDDLDTGRIDGNRDTAIVASQNRELGQIVDQFA